MGVWAARSTYTCFEYDRHSQTHTQITTVAHPIHSCRSASLPRQTAKQLTHVHAGDGGHFHHVHPMGCSGEGDQHEAPVLCVGPHLQARKALMHLMQQHALDVCSCTAVQLMPACKHSANHARCMQSLQAGEQLPGELCPPGRGCWPESRQRPSQAG